MKRREFLQSLAASTLLIVTQRTASSTGAAPWSRDLRRLRRSCAVLMPGDARYEAARSIQSAKFDRRPAAIVQCSQADHVQRAIAIAREHALPLAVRSGGHSLAGHGICEGGIVLDLRAMNAVRVDPRTALAHVGGGTFVGKLDQASALHGLATVLGECPTVGISGFALGGGEGLLMGPYGMGCDNIRAVDLALADGSLIHVDADSHPELLWALRGGGGNFGVVTGMQLALHPVRNVYAGMLRFKPGAIADVLEAFRICCDQAPPALTLLLKLFPTPDRRAAILIRVCHTGEAATADHALRPLLDHPALAANTLASMPYLDLQAQGPAAPEPVSDITRSGFFPALDDMLIDAISRAVRRAPGDFTIFATHLHGATTGARNMSAFPLREPGFDCWFSASWEQSADEPAAVDWVTSLWSQTASLARGAYINGLEDEGPARIREAYLGNFDRLQAAKTRYDPDNLFRGNQNVPPL